MRQWLRDAKRRGAKTRRGTPCNGMGMPNGRCRMHGGTSPGVPKDNKNAWKARSLLSGKHRLAESASRASEFGSGGDLLPLSLLVHKLSSP